MSCTQPRSHIVDSRFFSSGYTTDEARKVFCDYRRLQRWLDVEVALAQSQAEIGIVNPAAALELAETGKLQLLNIKAIQNDIARTGHSLIPLLTAWQQITSQQASHYIHFGATTQDIQDSAQSLELRDILSILERDMHTIIDQLAALTDDYQHLVIIGRTHGQHALPTTLGLKFAVWLDEMLRNGDRLQNTRDNVLVSQLFGGVGTMAAFGSHGLDILDIFSRRLQLQSPLTAWHTARDRLAEFMATLAIIAGTMAKIANEICQLARDEIGELEEPFHLGKIGSTTMPHKRNPELCEQVVVLARLIRSNAGLGFETMISEHERDYRAIRLEWAALTDGSLYLCGAMNLMKNILGNLIIHDKKIARNVKGSAPLLSTEALLFLLGEKLGKPAAHRILYESAMAIHDTDKSLIDQLLGNQEIKKSFRRESLEQAVEPANHVGLAMQLTQRTVTAARKWLKTNRPVIKDHGCTCPFEKAGGCQLGG